MTSATHFQLTALCSAALLFAGSCGFGSGSTWETQGDGETRTPDEGEPPEESSFEPDLQAPSAQACRKLDGASAGPAPARLLTNYEYAYSVQDLLGYEGDAAESLPAENKVNGFENHATTHVASKTRVRRFMKAAETIAAQAVEERFDTLVPCDPLQVGESTCGTQFLQEFLAEAFRRPPTDGELEDFQTLFDESLAAHGFPTAVEMSIQAALQSPQFLYRLEFIDPTVDEGSVPVDDWEMASRLSYFLWASPPDAALREAARKGELSTDAEIRSQVDRMLEDPKSKRAVRQFHRQWLGLGKLDSVVKDSERFPDYQASMPGAWRESVRAFIEHTYFKGGGTVRDLFTSSLVFLNDPLVSIYETAGEPTDITAGDMRAYSFPADQRAGLLTQPGMMALLANANQSSPIRRGVWVRERLLCQDIPPPPPSSDLEPPDPDPDATTRERFRQHTEDPACRSCHKLIDPIGFGFERYDSMGRWRTSENGRQVDNSGTLAQTETPEIEGDFEGAVALADKLKNSSQVKRCISSKWFRFAMGRSPSQHEACALYHIQQAFQDSGGNFRELLKSLATSEAFRYREAREAASSSGSQP
jgi:hypothetical protein